LAKSAFVKSKHWSFLNWRVFNVQKILIRDYEDWKLVKRYRGLTFTVFNLDIAVKKMEKTLKQQSYLHVNRKKTAVC